MVSVDDSEVTAASSFAASASSAVASRATGLSAGRWRLEYELGRYWGLAGARALAFALAVVAVLTAANALIGRAQLPNYGTWTGIRPLEEKLALLDAASSSASPDALVLGSSIVDFGFDAEYFSQLVSKYRGVDYRAFNFSTGATEIVTMPKIYRLARTVSRPRELIIMMPGAIKRADFIPPRSPDYIMERAPIDLALKNPWLLPFAQKLWAQPLVRDSTAVRDELLFGRLANLPTQGADLYPIDAFGHTRSYSFQAVDSDIDMYRQGHITMLRPLSEEQTRTLSFDQQLEYYFNNIDIAAMRELRALTRADGVHTTLVASGVAATFYPEPISDSAYHLARRQQFVLAAQALDARLIYDVDRFGVPRNAVTDAVHLNYYGARLFTAQVAASWLNAPDIAHAEPVVPDDGTPTFHLPSDDVTINAFAAYIPTPDDGARTLQLRYMVNQATPPLPDSELSIMARRADGTEITVPALRRPNATFLANLNGLNVTRREMLLVRLVQEAGGQRVALNQPLAGFAWVQGDAR